MRRIVPSIVAAALVVAAGPALAHIQLGATLSGEQEVPPVSSSATATATFTLEDGQLEYSITTDLTGVVAAHLHKAPVGVSNPVPEITLDTSLSGVVATPLTEEQQDTLLSGGYYVNLHTAAHPLGEIRGQVTLTSVAGTTCSCSQATSKGAFKRCVRQAIKGLEKAERKSDEVKAVKRLVAKAACGFDKLPKKAVACCLPLDANANLVIEKICAAVPEAKCTSLGGQSKGTAATCGDPSYPCASPSGAFLALD